MWHIKSTATADIGELWAAGLHAIGASEDLWAHLQGNGWWALTISTLLGWPGIVPADTSLVLPIGPVSLAGLFLWHQLP